MGNLPRSVSEARPVPRAQGPAHRCDPCLGRPPGRQRLHVRIDAIAPRRERGMQAREPADGEQRRPGEREDAREKSRADDLGDDEHLQAQQAMPARDQPESEQLERKQDRGGYEEGNQRSARRKARDARLAPADARQLAEPHHAGLHGIPYPLFEKNPQRGQKRERAAHGGDRTCPEGSPHFHGSASSIAPTASAITPVASHPRTFRRRLTVKRPMISGRAAISIITAMMGTEITPLITALQMSALTGSISVKLSATPIPV